MEHIRITKIFNFEMAHALYGYDGPCKNIHGHSYTLEVTVSGRPEQDVSNPKYGMVIDFTDLKKVVSNKIIDRFDHALILNGDSPHRDIPGLHENFEKVEFVGYQPTCENMLIDFAHQVKESLPSHVNLISMRLRETPNSFAEWHASDQ